MHTYPRPNVIRFIVAFYPSLQEPRMIYLIWDFFGSESTLRYLYSWSGVAINMSPDVGIAGWLNIIIVDVLKWWYFCLVRQLVPWPSSVLQVNVSSWHNAPGLCSSATVCDPVCNPVYCNPRIFKINFEYRTNLIHALHLVMPGGLFGKTKYHKLLFSLTNGSE